MINSDFLVSVILPCYNEQDNVLPVYEALKRVLDQYSYEIIFIDDGSKDSTLAELQKLNSENQNVHYISFSRNFGHQNALKAGYDHANGDCIISMDADMQHPPEMIPDMIKAWQTGYDIVITLRRDRKIGFFKRISSRIFYALLSKISETEIEQGAADFRLVDRKVADVLKNFNENFLFFRGIIAWLGFKKTSIEYYANQRLSGNTKYSLKRMLKFAAAGITSFSVKPLRFAIYIGIIIAITAFLYGLYAIYSALFTSYTITGWTSLITSVLFIGGLQIIILGIIGEYLGKMFIENKKRPNYIIKEQR